MKLKNNKIWIIIVVIIIVISVSIGLLLKNKSEITENKKQEEMNSYLAVAKTYFSDTNTTITSIKALHENGYEFTTKEDDCSILELKSDNVEITETNCKKANELARKPVIEIESTNNFKINEWNKSGSILNVKLKNGGNSFYKETDITNINFFINDNNFSEKDRTLVIPNQNINTAVIASVELKDGEEVIEKKFEIMVDTDKPVLVEKIIDTGIHAFYEDFSDASIVKYYLDETKESPSKEDMKEVNDFDIECEHDYHVWSYAIDLAGNESNIDYLGTYNQNCIKVESSKFTKE